MEKEDLVVHTFIYRGILTNFQLCLLKLWEDHKIWKKSSTFQKNYLVTSERIGTYFFQIFVAFSEYLNFIRFTIYCLKGRHSFLHITDDTQGCKCLCGHFLGTKMLQYNKSLRSFMSNFCSFWSPCSTPSERDVYK